MVLKLFLYGALAAALGGGCSKETRERYRRNVEYLQFQNEGYTVCENPQENHHNKSCFNRQELRLLQKEGIPAGQANILVKRGGENIILLKKAGCDLSRYPMILDECIKQGLEEKYTSKGYTEEICTGKITLEKVLAYPPRFWKSGKRNDEETWGALHFLNKSISAPEAHAFPEDYQTKDILHCKSKKVEGEVAQRYQLLRQKYKLESWEVVILNNNHIDTVLAQWYFSLAQKYPGLKIEAEDIVALEKAIQEKKLTRSTIEQRAKEEYQHRKTIAQEEHRHNTMPDQKTRRMLNSIGNEAGSRWELNDQGNLEKHSFAEDFL